MEGLDLAVGGVVLCSKEGGEERQALSSPGPAVSGLCWAGGQLVTGE